jgi:segregation and condensation protein B
MENGTIDLTVKNDDKDSALPSLPPEKLPALIECLLFVAEAPVALAEIQATASCTGEEIDQALAVLQDNLSQRGIRLLQKQGKIQMVTAPEFSLYAEKFLGLSQSGRLSMPSLEALAIIAYKQPITRPEIDIIRGVNSDGVVRTLLARNLIEEVGRQETVGHPVLYGTTFEFLHYFGLNNLADLPIAEADFLRDQRQRETQIIKTEEASSEDKQN